VPRLPATRPRAWPAVVVACVLAGTAAGVVAGAGPFQGPVAGACVGLLVGYLASVALRRWDRSDDPALRPAGTRTPVRLVGRGSTILAYDEGGRAWPVPSAAELRWSPDSVGVADALGQVRLVVPGQFDRAEVIEFAAAHRLSVGEGDGLGPVLCWTWRRRAIWLALLAAATAGSAVWLAARGVTPGL